MCRMTKLIAKQFLFVFSLSQSTAETSASVPNPLLSLPILLSFSSNTNGYTSILSPWSSITGRGGIREVQLEQHRGIRPNKSKKQKKVLSRPKETLSYQSAIQALRTYHSIHGNLVIPRRYTIPDGAADYPIETHNKDLASAVYNMNWWQQNVRSHADRVAELNQIGFIWERLQPEWNLVVEALITYNNLFGNLLVPSSFVVPCSSNNTDDTIEWPRGTWGIPLGRCVRSIRSRQDFVQGKPDRLAQLIAMGFVWDVSEYQFRKCFRAIEYYTRNVAPLGGRKKTLRIPNTFVVPSGEGWPEELWNYPLGAKCCAIRQKGLFVKDAPERKAALEEIGFQWSGNASLGWLEVVHAAAIYSQIHGRQLNVPQTFVVPSPSNYSSRISPLSVFGGGSINETWPWPGK